MKKLLFLCLLVLCYACEVDKSVDPTLMPEATTTGQNTLGCLIDGWVYTSGRYGIPEAGTYVEEENHYVTVEAQIGLFVSLRFTLVNPRQGAACQYIHATLEGKSLVDGEAYITRMNETVISGTFSGGNVQEGRFDIKYSGDSEGEDGVY